MSFINLQKHYPTISLIFLFILIASFFFWPEYSGYLAIVIFVLGLGMSFALIIQRNRDANVRHKRQKPKYQAIVRQSLLINHDHFVGNRILDATSEKNVVCNLTTFNKEPRRLL